RTDIVRRAKSFAGRADKITFERFLGRESNGMQHEIEPVGFATDLPEKFGDVLVFGHVAWPKWRSFAKFAHQLLDIFLQALALVIENQLRSGRGPRFRDGPRDTPLVRHAKDKTELACENLLRHNALTIAAFRSPQSKERRLPRRT